MKRIHSLLLLSLAVMLTVTNASETLDLEEKLKEDQDRGTPLKDATMQELQEQITTYLGTLEEPWLPFLPLLSFDSVSLALTEVSIFGLGDAVPVPDFGNNQLSLSLTFPALTFYSGHYIIGGKINDLPIIGESTANVTLQGFNVLFSVGLERVRCAVKNTTTFVLTAQDIFVNFANLNPEHEEEGVLINTILESVGDDILKWLSLGLSPGGNLHAKLDPFIVSKINERTKCPAAVEETYVKHSLPELDMQGMNVISALQVLADQLGGVFSDALSNDVFLGQLQQSVHSRAKQMMAKDDVNWVY